MSAFAALTAFSLTTGGLIAVGGVGADAAHATDAPAPVEFTSASLTEWTVPAGVTSITATVQGASGGSGDGQVYFPGTKWPVTADGRGGAGALVTGTFTVQPGESLRIWGSTAGGQMGANTSPGAGGAGYASGGAGGSGNLAAKSGGGGGGASAIARSNGAVLLVAGGGGGGAGRGAGWTNCNGGHGGPGDEAGLGATVNCAGKGSGGGAGAQASGLGSRGGSAGKATSAGGAGGGGAGYRGGNGGTAGGVGGAGGGGGGGGSSFIASTVTATALSHVTAAGNGSVSLSFVPEFATQVTPTPTTPTVPGNPIQITVRVTAAGLPTGTPAGTVSLLDASETVLDTATLIDGAATFAARTFPVGSHALTARFTPTDPSLLSSESPVVVDVLQGETRTSLTVSDSAPALGEPISATIVVEPVAPAVGVPTGTVTLSTADGTLLGSGDLDAGQAVVSFTPTSVANLVLVAEYAGDTDFTDSVSSSTDVSVEKGVSTLTLTSDSTTSVWGEQISFTAAVAAPAPASGTVSFLVEGVSVGSAAILNGAASFAMSDLEPGTYGITASYNGDINIAGSTSNSLEQLVEQSTTSTTVGVAPSASAYGQNVTLTAGVATSGAGEPTGNVDFYVAGVHVGRATIDNGSASLSAPILPVGTHQVAAVYAGDSHFIGSTSTAVGYDVSPASTTLRLSNDSTGTVFGEAATFTADAESELGQVSAGTIEFVVDGGSPVSVPLVGGAASLTVSDLGVGAHDVAARLLSEPNFDGSVAAAVEHSVSQAATTLTINSDASPALFGESITLLAELAVVEPGAGVPTGMVTFSVDGNEVGTGSLNAEGTQASLSIPGTLAVGMHELSARFGGDASFLPSESAAAAQAVEAANVEIQLGAVSAQNTVGTNSLFTATVLPAAPSAAAPTGDVQFYLDGKAVGAPVALTAPSITSRVSTAGPTATLAWTLKMGEYAITAAYLGDAGFKATTSDELVHTVAPESKPEPEKDESGKPNGSDASDTSAVARLAETGADASALGLAGMMLLAGMGLGLSHMLSRRRRGAQSAR